MSVIADTTVVSTFAGIGQLDLLREVFGTLYISTEVHAEIRAGFDEGYFFYEAVERVVYPYVDTGWLHLATMADEEELRLFGAMPAALHRGEASVLAIARHRGWTVLTDDRAARNEALRLNIPLSGTIGCLVLAIERGLCSLDQANSWLQDMITRGYRSPVTDLSPLIQL